MECVRQPPDRADRRSVASSPPADARPWPTISTSWASQAPTTVEELSYPARKRVHNLKYYTWVEQQGKTYDEIQAQWYQPDYWTGVHGQADEIDVLIEEFNAKVGLL